MLFSRAVLIYKFSLICNQKVLTEEETTQLHDWMVLAHEDQFIHAHIYESEMNSEAPSPSLAFTCFRI